MAVKLRLTRLGRRHRPFFRINAVEARTPRDGKILERLGHYDPIEKDKSKQVVIDTERVRYWLEKGAIPTETVAQLLARCGIKTTVEQERKARRQRAKAIAKKKGIPFTKEQAKPSTAEQPQEKKEGQ